MLNNDFIKGDELLNGRQKTRNKTANEKILGQRNLDSFFIQANKRPAPDSEQNAKKVHIDLTGNKENKKRPAPYPVSNSKKTHIDLTGNKENKKNTGQLSESNKSKPHFFFSAANKKADFKFTIVSTLSESIENFASSMVANDFKYINAKNGVLFESDNLGTRLGFKDGECVGVNYENGSNNVEGAKYPALTLKNPNGKLESYVFLKMSKMTDVSNKSFETFEKNIIDTKGTCRKHKVMPVILLNDSNANFTSANKALEKKLRTTEFVMAQKIANGNEMKVYLAKSQKINEEENSLTASNKSQMSFN